MSFPPDVDVPPETAAAELTSGNPGSTSVRIRTHPWHLALDYWEPALADWPPTVASRHYLSSLSYYSNHHDGPERLEQEGRLRKPLTNPSAPIGPLRNRLGRSRGGLRCNRRSAQRYACALDFPLMADNNLHSSAARDLPNRAMASLPLRHSGKWGPRCLQASFANKKMHD